jgi:hypothetical protein
MLLFCFTAQAAEFDVRTIPEYTESFGYGTDERNSLDNALTNSVDNILAKYIAPAVFTRHKRNIETFILSKAASYVTNYKILSIIRDKSNNANGSIRTQLSAEVDAFPLILDLLDLNIPLNLDNTVYGDIVAEGARIAKLRKHIRENLAPMFQPASKFIDFTVENIYFKPDVAVNGTPLTKDTPRAGEVPFVLNFYLTPNYDTYNLAIKRLTEDLAYYQLAERVGPYERYFPTRERFRLGSTMALMGVQALMKQEVPRAGDFQLAEPSITIESADSADSIARRQYLLHSYRTTPPFTADLQAALANNGGLAGDLSRLMFRIQFKNGEGKVIYNNVFSLFPAGGRLSIYISDEEGTQRAFWIDNKAFSLRTIGFVPPATLDKRPKITPYIYVEADGKLMATDRLFLGYHDYLHSTLVEQITTITIEAI